MATHNSDDRFFRMIGLIGVISTASLVGFAVLIHYYGGETTIFILECIAASGGAGAGVYKLVKCILAYRRNHAVPSVPDTPPQDDAMHPRSYSSYRRTKVFLSICVSREDRSILAIDLDQDLKKMEDDGCSVEERKKKVAYEFKAAFWVRIKRPFSRIIRSLIGKIRS